MTRLLVKYSFSLCFILLSLSSLAQRTDFTRYDSLRGTLNPMRSCFDVTSYHLQLDIDIDQQSIKGSNTICYKLLQPAEKIQIDLFTYYKIDSIVQNRKRVSFERDSHFVFINTNHVGNKSHSENLQSLTIYYQGKPQIAPHAPWDGGFVWRKDSLGNPWVGVACEGLGASSWWPCKDHPSDEPDSMTMRFTVPADLQCIANGNLIKEETLGNKKTYTWKISYPVNLYNVTLNIGKYAHFSETYKSKVDGEELILDYYVLSYNLGKAKVHFKQVHRMLDAYEKLFGKYPFYRDGFALVETDYWGMEHQGAIAYGNHYHNDIDEWDYIIIHESGHEWWGNSVSCSDHAELWIHESFCTYTEALLIEDVYGYGAYLNYLDHNKTRFKNKEPILGPYGVNYNYWEGSDMYYKGAWVLHSLRTSIGNDELWFSIIKGIAEKFKISIVTTEEIIKYINQRTGKDYTPFFNQYLKTKNIPTFEYSLKKKKKAYLLTYRLVADVPELEMSVIAQTGEKEFIRIPVSTKNSTTTITKEQATQFRIVTELSLLYINKLVTK